MPKQDTEQGNPEIREFMARNDGSVEPPRVAVFVRLMNDRHGGELWRDEESQADVWPGGTMEEMPDPDVRLGGNEPDGLRQFLKDEYLNDDDEIFISEIIADEVVNEVDGSSSWRISGMSDEMVYAEREGGGWTLV